MKRKLTYVIALIALGMWLAASAAAQDLGPQFKKIKDGIFLYKGKGSESNSTIILTEEGVVLIDTGNNPPDSRAVAQAIKKLTDKPVRFLINTEPHTDHTTGHFIFSPPAVIIAAAGASESMRQAYNPERMKKMTEEPGEMGAASKGYRLITPHVEYRDKMTLTSGGRTFELYYLKNVHSEADTAIWLPKERVLFVAASVGVKRFNNLRPFVSIPDTVAAIKMMRALNPEVVIPGHGDAGSVEILDNMERYYNLLVERVRQMAQQGKSLEEIKKELKMPEYDGWEGKDRFPNNIEAAYRAVKAN
jgi:cyclase